MAPRYPEQPLLPASAHTSLNGDKVILACTIAVKLNWTLGRCAACCQSVLAGIPVEAFVVASHAESAAILTHLPVTGHNTCDQGPEQRHSRGSWAVCVNSRAQCSCEEPAPRAARDKLLAFTGGGRGWWAGRVRVVVFIYAHRPPHSSEL